jgi:hypothetical protein
MMKGPTQSELMMAAQKAIQEQFPESSGWEILSVTPLRDGYKVRFRAKHAISALQQFLREPGEKNHMGRIRAINFRIPEAVAR